MEKAREDTNVKLLTGVYGDSNGGPLLYSLKIEAQAAPADETGAVDEAAARSARLDEVKAAQADVYKRQRRRRRKKRIKPRRPRRRYMAILAEREAGPWMSMETAKQTLRYRRKTL